MYTHCMQMQIVSELSLNRQEFHAPAPDFTIAKDGAVAQLDGFDDLGRVKIIMATNRSRLRRSSFGAVKNIHNLLNSHQYIRRIVTAGLVALEILEVQVDQVAYKGHEVGSPRVSGAVVFICQVLTLWILPCYDLGDWTERSRFHSQTSRPGLRC